MAGKTIELKFKTSLEGDALGRLKKLEKQLSQFKQTSDQTLRTMTEFKKSVGKVTASLTHNTEAYRNLDKVMKNMTSSTTRIVDAEKKRSQSLMKSSKHMKASLDSKKRAISMDNKMKSSIEKLSSAHSMVSAERIKSNKAILQSLSKVEKVQDDTAKNMVANANKQVAASKKLARSIDAKSKSLTKTIPLQTKMARSMNASEKAAVKLSSGVNKAAKTFARYGRMLKQGARAVSNFSAFAIKKLVKGVFVSIPRGVAKVTKAFARFAWGVNNITQFLRTAIDTLNRFGEGMVNATRRARTIETSWRSITDALSTSSKTYLKAYRKDIEDLAKVTGESLSSVMHGVSVMLAQGGVSGEQALQGLVIAMNRAKQSGEELREEIDDVRDTFDRSSEAGGKLGINLKKISNVDLVGGNNKGLEILLKQFGGLNLKLESAGDIIEMIRKRWKRTKDAFFDRLDENPEYQAKLKQMLEFMEGLEAKAPGAADSFAALTNDILEFLKAVGQGVGAVVSSIADMVVSAYDLVRSLATGDKKIALQFDGIVPTVGIVQSNKSEDLGLAIKQTGLEEARIKEQLAIVEKNIEKYGKTIETLNAYGEKHDKNMKGFTASAELNLGREELLRKQLNSKLETNLATQEALVTELEEVNGKLPGEMKEAVDNIKEQGKELASTLEGINAGIKRGEFSSSSPDNRPGPNDGDAAFLSADSRDELKAMLEVLSNIEAQHGTEGYRDKLIAKYGMTKDEFGNIMLNTTSPMSKGIENVANQTLKGLTGVDNSIVDGNMTLKGSFAFEKLNADQIKQFQIETKAKSFEFYKESLRNSVEAALAADGHSREQIDKLGLVGTEIRDNQTDVARQNRLNDVNLSSTAVKKTGEKLASLGVAVDDSMVVQTAALSDEARQNLYADLAVKQAHYQFAESSFDSMVGNQSSTLQKIQDQINVAASAAQLLIPIAKNTARIGLSTDDKAYEAVLKSINRIAAATQNVLVSAGSGAVVGGAVGAEVGAVGGPAGSIFGAIIGGLIGLTSSFISFAAEDRENEARLVGKADEVSKLRAEKVVQFRAKLQELKDNLEQTKADAKFKGLYAETAETRAAEKAVNDHIKRLEKRIDQFEKEEKSDYYAPTIKTNTRTIEEGGYWRKKTAEELKADEEEAKSKAPTILMPPAQDLDSFSNEAELQDLIQQREEAQHRETHVWVPETRRTVTDTSTEYAINETRVGATIDKANRGLKGLNEGFQDLEGLLIDAENQQSRALGFKALHPDRREGLFYQDTFDKIMAEFGWKKGSPAYEDALKKAKQAGAERYKAYEGRGSLGVLATDAEAAMREAELGFIGTLADTVPRNQMRLGSGVNAERRAENTLRNFVLRNKNAGYDSLYYEPLGRSLDLTTDDIEFLPEGLRERFGITKPMTPAAAADFKREADREAHTNLLRRAIKEFSHIDQRLLEGLNSRQLTHLFRGELDPSLLRIGAASRPSGDIRDSLSKTLSSPQELAELMFENALGGRGLGEFSFTDAEGRHFGGNLLDNTEQLIEQLGDKGKLINIRRLDAAETLAKDKLLNRYRELGVSTKNLAKLSELSAEELADFAGNLRKYGGTINRSGAAVAASEEKRIDVLSRLYEKYGEAELATVSQSIQSQTYEQLTSPTGMLAQMLGPNFLENLMLTTQGGGVIPQARSLQLPFLPPEEEEKKPKPKPDSSPKPKLPTLADFERWMFEITRARQPDFSTDKSVLSEGAVKLLEAMEAEAVGGGTKEQRALLDLRDTLKRTEGKAGENVTIGKDQLKVALNQYKQQYNAIKKLEAIEAGQIKFSNETIKESTIARLTHLSEKEFGQGQEMVDKIAYLNTSVTEGFALTAEEEKLLAEINQYHAEKDARIQGSMERSGMERLRELHALKSEYISGNEDMNNAMIRLHKIQEMGYTLDQVTAEQQRELLERLKTEEGADQVKAELAQTKLMQQQLEALQDLYILEEASFDELKSVYEGGVKRLIQNDYRLVGEELVHRDQVKEYLAANADKNKEDLKVKMIEANDISYKFGNKNVEIATGELIETTANGKIVATQGKVSIEALKLDSRSLQYQAMIEKNTKPRQSSGGGGGFFGRLLKGIVGAATVIATGGAALPAVAAGLGGFVGGPAGAAISGLGGFAGSLGNIGATSSSLVSQGVDHGLAQAAASQAVNSAGALRAVSSLAKGFKKVTGFIDGASSFVTGLADTFHSVRNFLKDPLADEAFSGLRKMTQAYDSVFNRGIKESVETQAKVEKSFADFTNDFGKKTVEAQKQTVDEMVNIAEAEQAQQERVIDLFGTLITEVSNLPYEIAKEMEDATVDAEGRPVTQEELDELRKASSLSWDDPNFPEHLQVLNPAKRAEEFRKILIKGIEAENTPDYMVSRIFDQLGLGGLGVAGTDKQAKRLIKGTSDDAILKFIRKQIRGGDLVEVNAPYTAYSELADQINQYTQQLASDPIASAITLGGDINKGLTIATRNLEETNNRLAELTKQQIQLENEAKAASIEEISAKQLEDNNKLFEAAFKIFRPDADENQNRLLSKDMIERLHEIRSAMFDAKKELENLGSIMGGADGKLGVMGGLHISEEELAARRKALEQTIKHGEYAIGWLNENVRKKLRLKDEANAEEARKRAEAKAAEEARLAEEKARELARRTSSYSSTSSVTTEDTPTFEAILNERRRQSFDLSEEAFNADIPLDEGQEVRLLIQIGDQRLNDILIDLQESGFHRVAA